MATIASDIFKAYDIRGIVGKSLTNEAAYLIGKAIAARGAKLGVSRIAVGRDGRLSGPELGENLMRGITESGLDVLNVGMVATPMLYFAAIKECGGSGVMITGSHNPPDYNGFKMMLAGDTLAGEAVQELLSAIQNDQFVAGNGKVSEQDFAAAYQAAIVDHIKLARPMNIVIDAGNGVPGAFAGDLFRALGCTVTELFCEVDGDFPNHHPDPAKPENLQDLIRALQNSDAEIGLAFDGDGDRLGVVTKDGQIIYPDRQLMLYAQDVLSRNPGAKVIFDVKSTRLLEILSRSDNPSAVLNALPESSSTPELNIHLAEGSNGHQVIAELAKDAKFEGAQEVITIDGLRVEFADGFGLMRASNTTPVLVLRFEGDDQAALERIQQQFKALIESKPGLAWPSK